MKNITEEVVMKREGEAGLGDMELEDFFLKWEQSEYVQMSLKQLHYRFKSMSHTETSC